MTLSCAFMIMCVCADLLVSFEEVVYHVNESVGWFEVCVTLEANVTGGVNLTVISQDNSTTGSINVVM